ncbi:MAG: hypothetical protein ACI4QA_02600 [Candidatus Spyradosoma sp.]
MKNFLRPLLFVLCALSATLFAEESAPAAAPAPAAPAEAPATERLFYSATLNESVFINDKEALYNARATMRVLQGRLDAVVFEAVGQGEIVSVNGDQVRDWSVRHAGSRTFLEIRPKKAPAAGESFTATVVGRKTLELPATITPMIFTGTDATAFDGMVRIVSTPELRLYGKQSRGLIPLGIPTDKNELAFAISGSPALRLDIARGSELLAPVSLESFSLVGVADGGTVHFRMRATANVRELGAEIAVLSGDAALSNFAESSAFSVRAEIDAEKKQPTYFLKFPQRGNFDVDLEFDARVASADGWRRLDFAVPAVRVAPFRLEGLAGEILFAPSSVSVPQPAEGGYAGYLPANGVFDLRWREVSGTPPEFSACVFSADAVGEQRVSTGVLALRQEIALMISQGSLSNLVFDLFGEGEILDVSGADVLSWSVEKAPAPSASSPAAPAPSGRLNVVLSRRKSGAYALRVNARSRFASLPATVAPLRIVPVSAQPDAAVCVRFNELVRIVNDGAVRCEILPRNGQTQIAASAFPQDNALFADSADAQVQAVYRISNGGSGLTLAVDEIRPDVSILQTTRCHFDSERIVQLTRQRLKIRAAPIYEWTVLVPDDCTVESVYAELLAGYELAETARDGRRELRLVFTEPLSGEQEIRVLTGMRASVEGAAPCTLRSLRSPQARFVRGFVGFAAAKNLRPVPVALDGLSEVPSEFYPQTSGTLPQQVFRMRGADWSADVRVEKTLPALHGSVSTVYEIASDRVRGNAVVRAENAVEPIENVSVALPKDAKFLGVEDAAEFFAPVVGEDGVVALQLRAPRREAFSFRVNFEFPETPADGFASADFSGVRLEDVSGEQGEIFVTSDRAVALLPPQDEAENPAVAEVARECVPAESFAGRGGKILLGAFQYVRRPFALDFGFRTLPRRAFPRCVVTRATGRLAPLGGDEGHELACRYEYLNDGETSLELELPPGTVGAALPEGAALSGSRATVPLSPGRGEFELALLVEAAAPAGRAFELALPRAGVPVLSARLEGAGEFPGRDFRDGRTPPASWGALACSVAKNLSDAAALLPALCVFAGTLAILLATRARRFWRVLVGGACAAALGVALFAGTAALRIGASPSYDFSVAVFGAGETVSARFTPWTTLGASLFGLSPATLFAVMAAGCVLLSVGAVWRRSAILRLAGRVGFYGAFVLGTSDAAHRVPALVAAILASEILLALVAFLFALKKRFGGRAEPPRAAAPSAVAPLLAAGTLALAAGLAGTAELRAAPFGTDFAEEELDVELARPQNIAERIAQDVRILSDRVVASGEIRVKGRAGERFDLLASPAVLTRFAKADEAAPLRLERRRGKNGIVYQIVLDRAGTFSASFAYELALSRDARGMTLPTGNAAADVVVASVDRLDSRLSAEGEVTLSPLPAEGATQRGTIVFKPFETRRILWNPRERDRAGETLALYAESADLYVPAAGTIEGFHEITLTPAQGEFARTEIRIPEGFSVSRADGASIRRWNFGRDNVLTVLFDSEKSEPVALTVRTQAPLDVGAPQRFAALEILNCAESVRTVGVATGDDLQVDDCAAPGLVVVDEKEFPEALRARAAEVAPGVQLRRAFRSVSGEAAFRVGLSEVKPNLRIDTKDVLVLNHDKVTLASDVTAEVSRADVFSLSFPLPEGLEVESVSGDALAYWSESQESADERKVTLFMKHSLSGEENFRVVLSGAFPAGAPTWTAPQLVFNGARRQQGELRVFTEEGLKLQVRSRDRVVEIPLAEAADDVPADVAGADAGEPLGLPNFAFRHGGIKWSLTFAVGSATSRATARWTQKIEPLEFSRYARAETRFECDVESAPRQALRVRLPKNALAPRFFGEAVAAASPVNAAADADSSEADAAAGEVWEIRFSKPMRGDVVFGVVYFRELARTMTFEPVSVLDVAEERGEITLVPGGVFRVAEDAPLARGTDFAEPVAVELEESVLADWRRLRSGVSDGSFVCPRLSRFTCVSADGWANFDVWEIEARRTDLLRVVSAGTEILGARLDGAPAAFFESDGDFYLTIPRTEDGAKARLEILSRGRFAEGKSRVASAPRTSARPKSVRWAFAPNVAGATLRVTEIFGLPADKVAAVAAPENAPACFTAFPATAAFETDRVPCSDEGAALVFETPVAAPPASLSDRALRALFGEAR